MASVRSSAAYRIAALGAAVFAWAIILLGAIVYFTADAEFGRQRDRDIAEELDRLSREPSEAELLRELGWREDERAHSRFDYALFDREGKRIVGSLDIAPPLPGLQSSFVRGSDGRHIAIRVGAIDLAGDRKLAVAMDSRAIGRVDRMILGLFLGAFVGVLAICAIGGLILAWYLRHRLKGITATADAIVTGDIEWRVPVGPRGDEFDAVGRSVNMMLDRIAGLMENLRQVSSDIAHDLRKPLIRLLLQTDRLGEEKGAEQRVVELGDELLMLFSGILRISEVEGGGLERSFEHIDLSTLMSEVAESFAPAMVDGGHEFDWSIEPGVAVKGSRELLAQLAANLLDNARIHTPAGTAITLALAAVGGDVRLSVEDNGPGVAEADREKLLQRFFRAEASRTTPGNGLGLSLVASVARAHGGAVAIADADPGLRIVVTLPRWNSSPTAALRGLAEGVGGGSLSARRES